MRVSGYLVPYPDPGAADLMSDHLEQVVQAPGPGKVLIRVSAPKSPAGSPGGTAGSGTSFARRKVELYRREGDHWALLNHATGDSFQEWDETSWEVPSPGTLMCRLTNMSGVEGQFSLECTYLPDQAP